MEKLQLSEEGKAACIENGITIDMVVEFQEEDISDLFKVFKDRFKVRNFIRKSIADNFDVPNNEPIDVDMPNNEPIDVYMPNNEPIDVHNHIPETAPISNKKEVQYSIEEMLKRKDVRGRPTQAQMYFRSILRDAAISSRIWKTAPMLSEISDNKKNAFFKAFELAPGLLNHKKELWKRLGESLQNRRKYLTDKGKGKRHTKMNTTLPAEQNQTDNLKVGDEVLMLWKDEEAVAEGILVKEGLMFSEVAVKKVYNICKVKEIDLPSAVGNNKVLTESLLKTVLKWKNTRLVKKAEAKGLQRKNTCTPQKESTVKCPKIASTSSLRKTVHNNATNGSSLKKTVHNASEDTSLNQDTNAKKHPGQVKSQTVKGKRKVEMVKHPENTLSGETVTKSLEVELEEVENDCSEESQYTAIESSQNKQESNTRNDVSDTDSESLLDMSPDIHQIGVYEWAKGDVFLGLIQGQSIVNCKEPFAKITNNPVPKLNINIGSAEMCTTSQVFKLNHFDIQSNPDENFCVMKCNLMVDKKRNFINIKNIQAFIKLLLDNFEAYAFE